MNFFKRYIATIFLAFAAMISRAAADGPIPGNYFLLGSTPIFGGSVTPSVTGLSIIAGGGNTLAASSFNGNGITAGTGTLTLGSATLNAGVGGTLAATAFSTNAANLSGTVASAQLTGAYTGITGLGTVSGLTVTSAFTATGLVTVADLVSPATTVNGQTCTLGSACTVTATASNTLTFGAHLTSGGSSYNGSAGVTITSDAASANTVSTIVARDGSGNFSAGTISAALSGNATTSTTATNLANGTAGALAYQTGAGATGFISAVATGNVLLSAGTNTVPAYSALPLTAVATQAANTVVANYTSGSAAPVAFVMPSCADSGGNHLNFVNNTGVTCGTGNAGVTSLAGTVNEITASASTGSVTLSLPSALTFTSKTVTGGTLASMTALGVKMAPSNYASEFAASAVGDVTAHFADSTGADDGMYITGRLGETFIGSGADYTSSAGFVAKNAAANLLDIFSGEWDFDVDTGKTPGASYTPSTRFKITTAGVDAIGYKANGTTGVSCAANTVVLLTQVVTNGIVTHC
jgi:hypothetical protein